jgi:restriction endonuclease S subunit
MLICETRRELVLPSYLLHYFTTAEGFAKILKASPGTAARNKTLKPDDLMAIQVPIPPLAQQIAFDSLYQKIERFRVLKQSPPKELDALVPSLLDRMFN